MKTKPFLFLVFLVSCSDQGGQYQRYLSLPIPENPIAEDPIATPTPPSQDPSPPGLPPEVPPGDGTLPEIDPEAPNAPLCQEYLEFCNLPEDHQFLLMVFDAGGIDGFMGPNGEPHLGLYPPSQAFIDAMLDRHTREDGSLAQHLGEFDRRRRYAHDRYILAEINLENVIDWESEKIHCAAATVTGRFRSGLFDTDSFSADVVPYGSEVGIRDYQQELPYFASAHFNISRDNVLWRSEDYFGFDQVFNAGILLNNTPLDNIVSYRTSDHNGLTWLEAIEHYQSVRLHYQDDADIETAQFCFYYGSR